MTSSLYDALVIQKKQIEINKKMWVCSNCLKLLTLAGALKDFFIVPITVESACELCGKNKAEFFIGPKKLGIFVCDECLNEKGGQVWKRHRKQRKGLCDLCRKKEGTLFLPP